MTKEGKYVTSSKNFSIKNSYNKIQPLSKNFQSLFLWIWSIAILQKKNSEEILETLLMALATLLWKIHNIHQRVSDARWPNGMKVSLSLFNIVVPNFMGPQNFSFMEYLLTFQGTSIPWNTFWKKTIKGLKCSWQQYLLQFVTIRPFYKVKRWVIRWFYMGIFFEGTWIAMDSGFSDRLRLTDETLFLVSILSLYLTAFICSLQIGISKAWESNLSRFKKSRKVRENNEVLAFHLHVYYISY